MWRVVAVGVALVWLPPVLADTTMWRGISSSYTLPEDAVSESYPESSESRCATRAARIPWCNLFVYRNGSCDVYDVPVDSDGQYRLVQGTKMVTIFTRFKNVCIEGDRVYQHGELKSDGCATYRCFNQNMLEVMVPLCCPPFEVVGSLCYHLHTTPLTYHEAMTYCQGLDGDLAHIPDFCTLQEFIKSRTTSDVWVGVKGRQWLDGRGVAPEEWLPKDNEPNEGSDVCARMKYDDGQHMLADRRCDITYHVLCQKNQ